MSRTLLVIAAMLALLFAGCVNVSVDQKVDRDGSSQVSESVDMSALLASLGSMAGPGKGAQAAGAQMQTQMDEQCKKIMDAKPGTTCTYSSGVLALSQKMTPEAGGYKFEKRSSFPYIEYVLTTDSLPNIDTGNLSSLGGGAGASTPSKLTFTDSKMKAQLSTLKLAGAKISYTIEMPGELVSADNGEMKDGKAAYDVLALVDGAKTVTVVSHELDTVTVAIVVIVVLAIIAAVAYFVFLRGKPGAPSSAKPAAQPPAKAM